MSLPLSSRSRGCITRDSTYGLKELPPLETKRTIKKNSLRQGTRGRRKVGDDECLEVSRVPALMESALIYHHSPEPPITRLWNLHCISSEVLVL